jgi:diguanylate cyclase (GGDEF)-like protein/PAS domain S-box-containing protein
MDEPAANDPEGAARAWWRALAGTAASGLGAREGCLLLAGLLDRIIGGVCAEPFDPSLGHNAGASLAAAGWVSPDVPASSAGVLAALAPRLPHADAPVRMAAVLAALGQGYQARLCGDSRTPHGNHDDLVRLLFDNAAAAIAIGDTDGTVLKANRRLAEMIGMPVEELTGISVYDFAHPDDHQRIRELIYGRLVAAGTGTVSLRGRLVRADGSVGWTEFGITYVRSTPTGPDYLIAVGADATERHLKQLELRYQALHDPLTGLPNRRRLLAALAEMRGSARSGDAVGLCFVDVDRFKDINDGYGHSVGDKLLTALATRLREANGHGTQYLVSRIGGDEFVAVVPPPATNEQVTAIARRMAAALDDPLVVDGHRLSVSVSIGTIVTSITDADADSLLDAADTSLYHAKAYGDGRRLARTAIALREAHDAAENVMNSSGARRR